MGDELEHLSDRDREILGMNAEPSEAPEETKGKRDSIEWIGHIALVVFVTILVGSVLSMIGMLAAWWLLWLYGALF